MRKRLSKTLFEENYQFNILNKRPSIWEYRFWNFGVPLYFTSIIIAQIYLSLYDCTA